MRWLISIISSITSVAVSVTAPSVSCRNELGAHVDAWWILKAPAGTNYLYADSDSPILVESPYSLNDTSIGALTFTTQQLWGVGNNLLGYAIYNDEVPNDPNYNYTYGHTKGYFAIANDGSAIYVTHSIPLFPVGPAVVGSYSGLGSNAWTYAQDAACFSISADTMNAIAGLLLLNSPQIYDSIDNIVYKNVTQLILGNYNIYPICSSAQFTTTGGLQFTVFAKSAQWNNELYSACVAPTLRTSLWTETWIRGSQEPASCPSSGYDVIDIDGITLTPSMSWTEYNDHSKWVVTPNATTVCFGDINRMTSQYNRAGGTQCFQSASLATQLKSAVTGFQDTC